MAVLRFKLWVCSDVVVEDHQGHNQQAQPVLHKPRRGQKLLPEFDLDQTVAVPLTVCLEFAHIACRNAAYGLASLRCKSHSVMVELDETLSGAQYEGLERVTEQRGISSFQRQRRHVPVAGCMLKKETVRAYTRNN